MQEQLDDYRHVIDKFIVDENEATIIDLQERDQQDQSNTKYSTIQKFKHRNTQSRVKNFEELLTCSTFVVELL